MGGRFGYLFLSGAVLAAAVAAGIATWLEWLPCRGSMLNGSILLGYQYPAEFTEACLMRMDGSDAVPLAAGTLEARALSALLLGLGWLAFASRLRLPTLLRAVVLLPALPIGWFAVQTWLSSDPSSLQSITTTMLLIELAAFAATAVISLRLIGDQDQRPSLVGLWAVTAYGVLHVVGDYFVMSALSDATWDSPPGTGYPTVVFLALCGIVLAYAGWSRRRSAQLTDTARQAPLSLG